MRTPGASRAVLACFVLVVVVGLPVAAVAQQPGASSTTEVEVPAGDIIPKPNAGVPPEEPGDRGGALQLGLLALVVLAVAGAVGGLVRQSRRARE
jgi:hypothetical protein